MWKSSQETEEHFMLMPVDSNFPEADEQAPMSIK